MGYIRRNQDPTDDGLTFESDGIPQFCGEFREVFFELELTQLRGGLGVGIYGYDIKWRKCMEEDPVCYDTGSELLPGRYTAEIKYELESLDDTPVVVPQDIPLETKICNAVCDEDMRDDHPLYVFVDVLNETLYDLAGPIEPSGIMNLAKLANLLCTDEGTGESSKRRLTINFKFLCYMKKSACEDTNIFGSTYDACDEYFDYINLGLKLDDKDALNILANVAVAGKGMLSSDIRKKEIDEACSTPKKGTPGFWEWVTSSEEYTGLNDTEIFTVRLCEVTESLLNPEIDCGFRDLTPDQQATRMKDCMARAANLNLSQIWDVLVGGGGVDAAQKYVVDNLRKCLCK